MYAIAAGSYSDYRVEKVTNDYLLAQQYCAYKNNEESEYLSRNDAYRIENIDLLEDVFKCEECDIVFNYKVTLIFDRNKYGLTYEYSSSTVMIRSNSILRDLHAYNVYDWHDEGDKSYITLYNIVVDKEDEELATAIALERAYVMLYELDCNITNDRVRLYDIMLSGHEPVMSVNLVIKYGEVRNVIISTWRAGISKSGTDAEQINGLRKSLAQVGIKIYATTPVTDKGRQAEVEYFIRRNQVSKYIIIDDDLSLFENPKKLKIFVPDYRIGLAQGDIKKIMRLIGNGCNQ